MNSVDEHVTTTASRRVDWLIRELTSASIGISGPRGVGKSTLLEYFCDTPRLRSASDLTVLLSAPTVYDRHEFLNHLFAEVCQRVLGENLVRPLHLAGILNVLRKALPVAAVVAGVAIALTGLTWNRLPGALSVLTGNLRWIVVGVGLLMILTGLVSAARISGRGTIAPQDGSKETDLAIAHLQRLRFQQTTSTANEGNWPCLVAPNSGPELPCNNGSICATTPSWLPISRTSSTVSRWGGAASAERSSSVSTN